MAKSIEGPGLFIISNSPDYESEILGKFLSYNISDFDNIILVYDKKIPDLNLERYGKRVVSVPFEFYNKIENASSVESLDLSRTVMVIKDLRYMIKRLDERLSMMQIKHSCYKKVVIDTMPFYVDVWKYYFPFSFFDKTLLGYSHSYAFEADIRNHDSGVLGFDPCDAAMLAKKTYGSTFINYRKFFNFEIVVEEYRVTEEEQKKYDALKEDLFIAKKTIKPIISGLYKYSSSLVPGHNLPLDLKAVYEWSLPEKKILKTNLKVDNYLYSEMCKLINTINILAENLYGD
jgi:hypothetical protein